MGAYAAPFTPTPWEEAKARLGTWVRERIVVRREAEKKVKADSERARIIHFATTTHRVSTPSTSNVTSYASGAFTPTANDLLFAWVVVTGSRDDSGAGLAKLTDSQGLGWVKVERCHKVTSADTLYLFVACTLAAASSMTVTFDCTGDAGTGAIIEVCSISSMTRTGIDAVRQTAKQENQSSGTPASTFAASCLTGNVTAGCVSNGANGALMTPPSGWTEQIDTGFATPTTGLEYATRDSGFTGTTITWGNSSLSAFGDMIVEFDTSAASFTTPFVWKVGAVATAASGNLTVVPPSGIANNDICVIVVNESDTVTPTITGYTQKNTQTQGTALRQTVFWKRSSGSESNTTVTRAGGNSAAAYMIVVRGAAQSGDPFDVVSSQANTSSATVTSPNVTPAADPACTLFLASEELTGNTSGAPTYQVWSGTYPTFQELVQGANGLGSNEISCAAAWGGSTATSAYGARTVTVVGEAATPTGNIGTIAVLLGNPLASTKDIVPAQINATSDVTGAIQRLRNIPVAGLNATSSMTASVQRLRPLPVAGISASSDMTAAVTKVAGGSAKDIIPGTINATSDVTSAVQRLRPISGASITSTSTISASVIVLRAVRPAGFVATSNVSAAVTILGAPVVVAKDRRDPNVELLLHSFHG